MERYRVQFEAEIDVKFEDPEAAKAFYIDGDWSKAFWHIEDLPDLADTLANCFHHEDDRYNKEAGSFFTRFVEGFGFFIRGDEEDEYCLTPMYAESGGQIRVRYNMEIESTWIDELKPETNRKQTEKEGA